jgi:predicted transcriptional regulator
MASTPRLSELEHDVMNVIWRKGAATAAEVARALTPERTLKDSTVRTILTRLEDKKYVKHEVDGRTFVYSGIERPGSVAARAVKQILDRLCHGSLESLLVGMVDHEMVDPRELEKIADRLNKDRLSKERKGHK